MVPMSLLAYDNLQVEADAERTDKELRKKKDRIFKDLKWIRPASRAQYITFWTIQSLDVYSTYRITISCVVKKVIHYYQRTTYIDTWLHIRQYSYILSILYQEILLIDETMQWVNGFIL